MGINPIAAIMNGAAGDGAFDVGPVESDPINRGGIGTEIGELTAYEVETRGVLNQIIQVRGVPTSGSTYIGSGRTHNHVAGQVGDAHGPGRAGDVAVS